ncbi:MAG: hypothetical protein ACOC97_00615 [Myxococcota bacterium]
MSIRSTLLGAAALYALGRMTHDMTADDIRRYASTVSGINPDDVKKLAWDTADDWLLRAGLRRTATIPSATAMVLGGVGAGLILGAGITFFMMSDAAKGMRGEATTEERATNGSEQAAGTA